MPGCKSNKFLTTGDVARLCEVAPRTVAKWMESGDLKGHRVPGPGKHRRFEHAVVAEFIQKHGMPFPDELVPYRIDVSKLTDRCPKCGGYLSRVANRFHCVVPTCAWTAEFEPSSQSQQAEPVGT